MHLGCQIPTVQLCSQVNVRDQQIERLIRKLLHCFFPRRCRYDSMTVGSEYASHHVAHRRLIVDGKNV